MTLSDRIVLFREGGVEQVGTPEEIYESPADLFVADFIGTINLLEGTVLSQNNGHIEVATPGVPAPLLATPVRAGGHTGTAGGAVTMAIRPEAIVVEPGPDRPGLNRVAATVVDRSYLGDHIRYRLRLGDVTLTVQTSAAISGTEVTIGLPTERTLAYEGGGDRG